MKKIYFNKKININYNKNILFFIIVGNEIVLINENIKKILKKAKKIGYLINKKVESEKNFNNLVNKNFFYDKKIIIINTFKINFFNSIIKFIKKINKIKNQKIIIIINFFKLLNFKILNKILKHIKKYKLINCNIINYKDVINWIEHHFKKKKIKITKNAKKLLYNIYKNNFTELKQIIYQCKILFYKKKYICSKKIKNIINIFPNFNYINLINFFFTEKIEKSIEIINKICKKKYNIETIITTFYKKIINIIMSSKNEIYKIHFNKIKINENNNKIYKNYIIKISKNKMYRIIRYITIMEIEIKKNKKINFWKKIKILLLIIKK
ncbi:DNA polymerase III subunit delta [Buchnera aphidicola (Ceratovacuna keduensis)]|uniref:DNA polymerase III subunit delta n=1 Tax=Buchnera aphidicola TaxID=9 RepID=UPI0031B8038A